MFACVFVHMWVCQLHLCVSVDVREELSRECVRGVRVEWGRVGCVGVGSECSGGRSALQMPTDACVANEAWV